MAELDTVTRTKIAQKAGVKVSQGSFNRDRTLFIDTPAAWSAANGDTFGTGIVIPAGSRFRGSVRLSTALGTASTTLSLGIRDAGTKVAIDATALVAAASIATAQEQDLSTGTKLTAGQFYVTPVDVEIYGTFGGATPLANQAIRAEVTFVSA